jgi:3-oxoadipate enol-lactonase
MKLFFREKGRGNALLLIHGLGSNHKLWKFQVREFSKHFRTITPDLRGHGKSLQMDKGYSIKDLAEDCSDLLEQLNINRALVLGVSMGAAVALKMAIEHPQKVSGLSLVNAWSYCDEDMKVRLKEWISRVTKEGIDSLIKDILKIYFTDHFFQKNKNKKILTFYEKLKKEQSKQTYINDCRACLSFDVRDKLNSIRTPTFLISGDLDILVPPFHAKRITSTISNSSYWPIQRNGHVAFLEKPMKFNRLVLSHLQSITRD